MEQPRSKWPHVYALVRFDFPMDPEIPENTVTVVKVFRSKAYAEQEAERLNNLNASKSCKYVVCTTRMVTAQ